VVFNDRGHREELRLQGPHLPNGRWTLTSSSDSSDTDGSDGTDDEDDSMADPGTDRDDDGDADAGDAGEDGDHAADDDGAGYWSDTSLVLEGSDLQTARERLLSLFRCELREVTPDLGSRQVGARVGSLRKALNKGGWSDVQQQARAVLTEERQHKWATFEFQLTLVLALATRTAKEHAAAGCDPAGIVQCPGSMEARHSREQFKRVSRNMLKGLFVVQGARSQGSRSAPRAQRTDLRVLSWNTSGIGGGVYQELMAWLELSDHQAFQLVILQATHWQQISDYTSGGWQCVHSSGYVEGAQPDRSSGLLIMLAKTHFCDIATLQMLLAPQFAYTKNRGTADALLRVHAHFAEISRMLKENVINRFQKQQGQDMMPIERASDGLLFGLPGLLTTNKLQEDGGVTKINGQVRGLQRGQQELKILDTFPKDHGAGNDPAAPHIVSKECEGAKHPLKIPEINQLPKVCHGEVTPQERSYATSLLDAICGLCATNMATDSKAICRVLVELLNGIYEFAKRGIDKPAHLTWNQAGPLVGMPAYDPNGADDEEDEVQGTLITTISSISSELNLFQEHLQAQLDRPVAAITQQLRTMQAKLQHKQLHCPDVTTAPGTLEFLHELLVSLRRSFSVRPMRHRLVLEDHMPASVPCPTCSRMFPTLNAMRVHSKLQHGILPEHTRQPTAFDATRHSVNGMPECRLCRRRFFRWQQLQKHIEQGSCAALGGESLTRHPLDETEQMRMQQTASATPPVDVANTSTVETMPEESLPLVRRPSFLNAQHRWEQWALDPAARAQLMSYCVLCNMWLASSKHVKQHFNRIHASDLGDLPLRANRLCLTFKSKLTRGRNCLFCHSKVGAPTRHSQQCTVLFQLTVAHLVAQEQEAEIFKHFFPSGAPPPVTAPPPAGRQAAYLPQPPFQLSGHVRLISKVVLQQADALQLLQQDRGLMMFLKQDSRSVLPSMLAMAREWRQKKEQGDPALVSPLRTVLLAGLLKELLQRLQAISATAEGRKSAQAAGWMTEGGDWSYMRWCPKAKRLLTDSSKPALQHTEAVRLLNMLYSNTKGDIVLNFHSTTGMQRLEDQGATTAAFKLEISLRGQDATEVHQALVKFINNSSTGLDGPQPQLMRLMQPHPAPLFRLANPGNQCYMNAVVYSLWLIARRTGVALQLSQVLGANAAGHYSVRQLFSFHLLGWLQPERQHDVTEFISHLLPKLVARDAAGGVELRQQQPEGLYRRFESSLTHCVILPAMHKHNRSLQALLNFWHTQDVMHALVQPHPWVLLQLPRFRWIRGSTQKCRRTYGLAHRLQVPVYQNQVDLAVQWVPYDIACIIQHHGPRSDQGHYTVIQLSSSAAGDAVEPWLLDDAKDPTSLDDAMCAHVSRNMYVVVLTNASTALSRSIDLTMPQPIYIPVNDLPRQEMDWHAAQLFLLEYQLRQIAADMARLNQIYTDLKHRVKMVEYKLDRLLHPRGHNKLSESLQVVFFDELDE
ncbi:jockey\pol, partial [Symbiodinium sp. CCMP2592]